MKIDTEIRSKYKIKQRILQRTINRQYFGKIPTK